MKWFIKSFDDYHEIESETYKTLELGCFPEKSGPGYCRYFGLFYKGRRPSRKLVLNSLLKKVYIGTLAHQRTGFDISLSEEELISEVPRW